MTSFEGIGDNMATCGTCLHMRSLHRRGACALAAGCSCVVFVDSVIRYRRPDASWMKRGKVSRARQRAMRAAP